MNELAFSDRRLKGFNPSLLQLLAAAVLPSLSRSELAPIKFKSEKRPVVATPIYPTTKKKRSHIKCEDDSDIIEELNVLKKQKMILADTPEEILRKRLEYIRQVQAQFYSHNKSSTCPTNITTLSTEPQQSSVAISDTPHNPQVTQIPHLRQLIPMQPALQAQQPIIQTLPSTPTVVTSTPTVVTPTLTVVTPTPSQPSTIRTEIQPPQILPSLLPSFQPTLPSFQSTQPSCLPYSRIASQIISPCYPQSNDPPNNNNNSQIITSNQPSRSDVNQKTFKKNFFFTKIFFLFHRRKISNSIRCIFFWKLFSK